MISFSLSEIIVIFVKINKIDIIMNKQQLANKIWASANKMRSKIDANEYKDYILGLIFYKFLSDNEVSYLKKNGFNDDNLTMLEEDYEDNDKKLMIEYCQKNVGYFIEYKNLFSTWLLPESNFSVSDLSGALSSFNRLVSEQYKKVYDGIFKTLQAGLSKLGESVVAQTRALKDLIKLIKDIPTDGSQDYDVLGYVYEYLISNFAANAGKKAGEFYTPHEVAQLMSEIVTEHHQNKDKIEIYDPTSGSGSLLITIGKSIGRHIADKDRVKYYAQELKENTYNLTRMNLVMRGIRPSNIVTRCADSLADDWPLDTNGPDAAMPLYVDAVVSNPPYSQQWNAKDRELDPRFVNYGVAPKSKADYAFLLHELHHLKPDGILTIILPHGVLFRGGEEGEIRKNLIEKNNIDTIIGLPANIFFGTGIPTLVMVLKQHRDNDDVLIIDASKGFVKDGKNNKLRACDVKKIADTVRDRKSYIGFSKVVSRNDIRDNEYNLNIPRYVDSSESAEQWDIYSTMFGGIPKTEIDELQPYWDALPGLRESLFSTTALEHSQLQVDDVRKCIEDNESVIRYIANHKERLGGLQDDISSAVIDGMETVKVTKEEESLADNIFNRIGALPLIDKYQAYQILDDQWRTIENDLEIIQTEGRDAIREVDPNMVVKKQNNDEIEVQDGWRGHIMPFKLVQQNILKEEYEALMSLADLLEANDNRKSEILESLSEDEQCILNDDNTDYDKKALSKKLEEVLEDVETEEIRVLNDYLCCSRKPAKLAFIAEHTEVNWNAMEASKDGSYAKSAVNRRIMQLKMSTEFPEDSFESKVVEVNQLMEEEKAIKADLKQRNAEIEEHTIDAIHCLTDSQIKELLQQKWIVPICDGLETMSTEVLAILENKVQHLAEKYAITFAQTEQKIRESENSLCKMMGELTGSESDMQGIEELWKLLK